MKNIRSNIGKLYALSATQNALTIVPVLVPFYQENGIPLSKFLLLQGVFTFMWVLAEIPTGYLSDRWSRRNTIIVGCIFYCIGGLLYCVGTQFWHFFLVQVLMAIGVSLHSGTTDALTYETLHEIGETGKFRKICGQQAIVQWVSLAIAGLFGAFIAHYSLRAAVISMVPFFFIGLLISLALREPKKHQIEHTVPTKMLDIWKDTMLHNKTLRNIICFFSITAAMTFCLVWFTQPYQEAVGMPLYLFGISNAVFMIGLVLATKSVHVLEKYMDDRTFLVAIAIIVLGMFGILALPISWWGMLALLVGRSTYGALSPLTTDMINRVTSSERRATVLSIRSFTYNLTFTIASPLLGYAVDLFTLNQALLIIGITGGILMLITLIVLMRQIPARA